MPRTCRSAAGTLADPQLAPWLTRPLLPALSRHRDGKRAPLRESRQRQQPMPAHPTARCKGRCGLRLAGRCTTFPFGSWGASSTFTTICQVRGSGRTGKVLPGVVSMLIFSPSECNVFPFSSGAVQLHGQRNRAGWSGACLEPSAVDAAVALERLLILFFLCLVPPGPLRCQVDPHWCVPRSGPKLSPGRRFLPSHG